MNTKSQLHVEKSSIFFSVLLYFTTLCSILSVHAWCLWLSNIDEEQSEEWCNGVLERESSKLTNGAFLWVSAGASRMITSAPLSFQHCAVVSVFFFFFTTQLSSNILTHASLSVPSSPSCCPFSFLSSARLGLWASPVSWIREWLSVAVGRNPEVQVEPSQSPPWACHVPDLWHHKSEGRIGLLWEDALLLEAGWTEQPAGQ